MPLFPFDSAQGRRRGGFHYPLFEKRARGKIVTEIFFPQHTQPHPYATVICPFWWINNKMPNSSFKCCTRIHLALYLAAIVCLVSWESIIRVFDQLTETFEFVFSPLPFKNAYLLSDAGAETIVVQLIVLFLATAVPSYIIGYPLFLRYFNKRS